jgi:hypothetical protein
VYATRSAYVAGLLTVVASVLPTAAAAGVDATGGATASGCPAGRFCYYSAPNFDGAEDRADADNLVKAPNGACITYRAPVVRSIDNRTFHSILGYTDDKCEVGETRVGPGIQARDVKYRSGRLGMEILPEAPAATPADPGPRH